MSSAASSRSAINRQKLALQRMRAARTPTKPQQKAKQQGDAVSNEMMRVKLLPRIADYRSKGWINEEEESDYHQLLSNKEFGSTGTDHCALQVKKALDLAKVKHEALLKTTTASSTTAAPSNSRSLFRKQTSVGGSELTLQKKLSHRRKSRLAGTETSHKNDSSAERQDKKPIVMESKELSIVEAMFGKEEPSPSPADKQKDLLARARQRRRSSFSPEAVKSNATEDAPKQQQDESGSVNKEEPPVALKKPSLSTVAATRLHSMSSKRSIYNRAQPKLPPTTTSQGSLGEASTVSLSESESVERQENVDCGSNSVDDKILPKTKSQGSLGEARTVSLSQSETMSSKRSIYNRAQPKLPPETTLQGSLGEAPTVSLSESESVEQQENVQVGRNTVDKKILPKTTSQGSLAEAPTVSLSQSESNDQKENVDLGSSAVDDKILPKTKSQVSLGEALTVSISQSESNEQQENIDAVRNGNNNLDNNQHQRTIREQGEVLTEVPNMAQVKLKSVNNSHHGADSICEPRDLWKRKQVDSEEALRDLFVEMAFFARLGFVQPPSCLHCVYRESIEKTSPDLRCERFVPWRKNANVPIHPHQLDDNIIFVQCHAARSLVQGEGVQAYHWNKMKRQLVHQ